jgi:4-amino-4-deoxy-L-arabinose transferase-like glycosyltransferase
MTSVTTPPPHPLPSPPTTHTWRAQSIALITLVWAILQIGGLFTPGLLDDVDSVYLQIAREMLQRHDFVTPTIDGIRFFDKPPLMYWLAAGSMHLLGVHDWAARLPLALAVLALLLSVYALGNYLFSHTNRFSPVAQNSTQNDRAGLYAALAVATSIGPYLYTRFYIPDIVIALWMTLSIHLFLLALDRASEHRSALWPSLGFAAVLAFDVLTKGLIGVVFPLAFVALYLTITRRLKLLTKLHLLPATAVFLLIAAPWHILAALRNPAIAMPPGVGLPAHAGWAWFYLYNEHIARFLGRRIPHDYGQTPVWLFWLYAFIWTLPWGAFLPAAIPRAIRSLRETSTRTILSAPLTLVLWPLIVLIFFTLSSRQEYYSLPAIPALALLVGGLLASAEAHLDNTRRAVYTAHLYFLTPLSVVLAGICGYFAVVAPAPHPGVSLDTMLSSNPALYNLSLGHIFDLTTQALGFFRGPLTAVALGMVTLGPIAYLIRRNGRSLAANLTLAAGMTLVLLAAHVGLVRFYPTLGSKDLALTVEAHRQPGDILMIDGELTSGSTLLFYTGQSATPILLVNGHINGPWFGSFWPNSPHIFADDTRLHQLWSGPHRVFLLTYHPAERIADLTPYGPTHTLATSGGKTILTNR